MKATFEALVEVWDPLVQDYLRNIPQGQAGHQAYSDFQRQQRLLLASHGWTTEEFEAEVFRRAKATT